MDKATVSAKGIAAGEPSRAAVDSPASSLRIALLLESDGPGGAEIMILRLAEELRRRGHHVLHVGPAQGFGWLAERFVEAGFESETFSLSRPLDPTCLRGLVRLLRRQGVDVVHSHEFTMAVYGAAASRFVGRPHIITHHSNPYFSQRWRRRVAMRWACKHSDAVVAVSQQTRDQLETGIQLPTGSVDVVYNGMPDVEGDGAAIRREVGAHADELIIVALGNLSVRKGHIHVLRALAELQSRRSDLRWRLLIAGKDQGERERLQRFAKSQSLEDRVHLLGYRADIPDLLSAADVFVMPSLHEGLPLALLEAMLAGVAVIATDAGGVPEAVTTGVDGLITPAGDDRALVAALERVLSDPQLRASLGREARHRARLEFSLQAMGDAYERLYWEAVENRSTQGGSR